MVLKESQTKLRELLIQTLPMLCKSSLQVSCQDFCVEALIVVTVGGEGPSQDTPQTFVVNFKEMLMASGDTVSHVWASPSECSNYDSSVMNNSGGTWDHGHENDNGLDLTHRNFRSSEFGLVKVESNKEINVNNDGNYDSSQLSEDYSLNCENYIERMHQIGFTHHYDKPAKPYVTGIYSANGLPFSKRVMSTRGLLPRSRKNPPKRIRLSNSATDVRRLEKLDNKIKENDSSTDLMSELDAYCTVNSLETMCIKGEQDEASGAQDGLSPARHEINAKKKASRRSATIHTISAQLHGNGLQLKAEDNSRVVRRNANNYSYGATGSMNTKRSGKRSFKFRLVSTKSDGEIRRSASLSAAATGISESRELHLNEESMSEQDELPANHSQEIQSRTRRRVNRKNINNDSVSQLDSLPGNFGSSHRPQLIPATSYVLKPKKRCRVCYARKFRHEVRFCCLECTDKPGLCPEPCFAIYHERFAHGMGMGSVASEPSDMPTISATNPISE